MGAGFDLLRPLVFGLAGAGIVVIGTWIAAAAKPGWDRRPLRAIDAGAAWSASDSWMTNFTAIASVLSAAWAGFGTSVPHLVPQGDDTGIVVLFTTFALAAGLAPVIYASCARPGEDEANEGTVAGYLLAAFATLFAIGGEITALGMLISAVKSGGPAVDILIGALIVGAGFIVLYAVRTVHGALTAVPPDHGITPAARSLMVTTAKRSATL